MHLNLIKLLSNLAAKLNIFLIEFIIKIVIKLELCFVKKY